MTTDATAAGRSGGRARGQDHGRARLEDHEVRDIRDLAGTLPHGVIARRYHVSRTTVLSIIHRHTWKHLPEEPRP